MQKVWELNKLIPEVKIPNFLNKAVLKYGMLSSKINGRNYGQAGLPKRNMF
jgi:hypothetical protein